jgi:hypothetical protein
MLHILLFFIEICSKTEVFEQLYYTKRPKFPKTAEGSAFGAPISATPIERGGGLYFFCLKFTQVLDIYNRCYILNVILVDKGGVYAAQTKIYQRGDFGNRLCDSQGGGD